MTLQPERPPRVPGPQQAPERTHLHHVTHWGQHYVARRGLRGNPLRDLSLEGEITEAGDLLTWLDAPILVSAEQVHEVGTGLRFTDAFLSIACEACGAAAGYDCRDRQGQPRAEFHEYRKHDYWVQVDPTVHVSDQQGRRFAAKLTGLHHLTLQQDLDALEHVPEPKTLALVVDASDYSFMNYASVLLLAPPDPEW